jgi:hypothetical protein
MNYLLRNFIKDSVSGYFLALDRAIGSAVFSSDGDLLNSLPDLEVNTA